MGTRLLLAPNGTTYDSGEFTAVLDEALAHADWDGFAARKKESRMRGLLRGRGIGDYLEVTGPPANEMGGIRFEPDGDVTIITGTLDYGQGHWTPFAQVLHQTLGIPFDRIRRHHTGYGKQSGRRALRWIEARARKPVTASLPSPNGGLWGPAPLCWRYSRQIGRRLCRREPRSAQNRRCRATVRLWHMRP